LTTNDAMTSNKILKWPYQPHLQLATTWVFSAKLLGNST